MTAFPHEPAPPADEVRRRNRLLLTGAGVALALGLGVGVIALTDRPHPKPAATAAAGPPGPAAPASYRPIPGPYQPLSLQQIGAAFADGRRLYGEQGLSGLANAGIQCFQRLSRQPSYGLMDYCLALDVFGADTYSAAAGDEAPASTWFGQGPVRRLAAVQALTAGATDANARMLDTNRAIQQALAAAAPAPVSAQASAPVVVAQASRPQAPAPAAPTPAPPPQPRPQQPAQPEQPPPQRLARGPSFNCGYARSVTERMICAEPQLAAADRRLAAAFDRAMAQTDNPRALRRQQDRWLAARERAGDDYDAVLELYDIRTRELRDEP